MNNISSFENYPIRQYRIILAILFLEVLIYFFCDLHPSSFYKNTFIGFEQDPLLWFVYFTGLPQRLLNQIYILYVFDYSILLLMIAVIIKPLNNWYAVLLLILLFIFYSILTAHLGHRNYQSGYLFVLFPFIFRKLKNKQIVFEFTRYFLLFFYVSAAFFKFKSGSIFHTEHLSLAITNQFTPYFLELSNSVRTSFNLFLITHHNFAQTMYVGAVIFEFSMIIGFLTKRYDHYLAVTILIFHLTNWFIMDIAPVGQIAFICTLFFSRKFSWSSQS